MGATGADVSGGARAGASGGAVGVAENSRSLAKVGGGAVKVGMSDLTKRVAVGGTTLTFSGACPRELRVNLHAATSSNSAAKISSKRNCFITDNRELCHTLSEHLCG